MKNLTLKTLGRRLSFGVHCALGLTIVFSKAHEAEMYDRMKFFCMPLETQMVSALDFG